MRVVVQRVLEASVDVLVGVSDRDTERDAEAVGDKLAGLRVFADDEGKMNRSVVETGASVLVVSQFTLLGDVRKGRRPSFVHAAPPELADPLVQAVADRVAGHGVPVETGEFGAHMHVGLINDGPVTIIIETEDGRIR